MLKYRLISFVGLLGILAAAIFWDNGGGYVFAVLALLGSWGLSREMCVLSEKLGIVTFKAAAPLLGALLAAAFCFCGNLNSRALLILSFLVAVSVVGWGGILFSINKIDTIKRVFGSLGAVSFGLFPMFFLIMLYYDSNQSLNGFWLLYMVLVTKAGDTGAYICGMLSNRWMKNGNHKIVPKVSPKKSWEGTIGGLCFSVGVSFAFYAFDASFALSLPVALGLGVFLFIGGFLGDLTESAFKRACEVKDSGSIIPGMGGFFDVLDSFIYNAPLFYMLIQSA